jgi:hypothetical protein
MSDEFTAFRFVVTLDPADAYLPASQAALLRGLTGGAFQEVRGLAGDLEVMAYPEGDSATTCTSCRCGIAGRGSRSGVG